MSKRVVSYITVFLLAFHCSFAYALFGVGDIVYDPAAVAQLIEEIEHLKTMISQLQKLQHFADLDHINLAGHKFGQFLGEYKGLFDQIISQIQSYQGGGLMGAISSLESRYPGYHGEWDVEDEQGDDLYNGVDTKLRDEVKATKKQLLLTKIQMKHALMVGAKVRESLPDAEDQTRTLLDDTSQAVGVMQSIKIGNELTGMVAKSMQSLNVQLNEYLQAYAGSELEKNHRKGLVENRLRDAITGFGEKTSSDQPVPLNPVGRF